VLAEIKACVLNATQFELVHRYFIIDLPKLCGTESRLGKSVLDIMLNREDPGYAVNLAKINFYV
jgi:hypothetical protein